MKQTQEEKQYLILEAEKADIANQREYDLSKSCIIHMFLGSIDHTVQDKSKTPTQRLQKIIELRKELDKAKEILTERFYR